MSLRPRLAAALLALGLAAATLPGCSPQLAPEVGYTLIDGRKEQLSALRGKVVLVNFWATSCASCVKEMPDLAATYGKYAARGYDTVAVAMAYDPPAYVLSFAKSRALPFKVALDHDGELAKRFGDIQLTPTSVLIDRQGRIVKTYVGPPNFDELNKLVEKLLAA
ncbi:TlpA family protein disulfide reductase [Piscinibacter sp. Jin2]|uniref:TlpA family protein disulfide reductase n=1 Tax=Aquariibacter lacus TaxID=2801332 RepID=A0A9X1BPU7_9BURK|nr:TlpA disulfide reductase family protein [Piscinibacter lacus]MBL0718861.1 TlpA family protein disulfide reductase [Piscinibacter lacus]